MGAFFGVLVSDVVMDQIGRRRTLLTFTTASYLAGYALIFAACNEYMIWAGR
jgi:MFS family permease